MSFAVELTQLGVRYHERFAVENVNLQVERGIALGMIGANGSGKSTVLKTAAGLLSASRGSVRVLGLDPRRNRPGTIAYVPQIEHVDWTFPATVRDVVAMGRFARKRFYERFSRRDGEIIDGALAALGIEKLGGRHISALSGGQQQRAFLARALAQEPEVLLLDEPTTGVDAETADALRYVVRDLVAGGRTVLMSTHDFTDIEEWFDRVIVIDRTILAQGTPAEIAALPLNVIHSHGHGHMRMSPYA